jgi:hypothetical protein
MFLVSQGYMLKYIYGKKSLYFCEDIKNFNNRYLYLFLKVGLKNMLLGFVHSRFYHTPHKQMVILFII